MTFRHPSIFTRKNLRNQIKPFKIFYTVLFSNSWTKSSHDYNWNTVSCTYTQCRVVANFKILLPGDGNSLVFRYATWCTRSESLSGSDPSAVNTTRDPWASVVISVPDERALVAAGTLKKRNILKAQWLKKKKSWQHWWFSVVFCQETTLLIGPLWKLLIIYLVAQYYY